MAWHDPIGRTSDPTPDEFAKWISAQEAFAHLPKGVNPPLSAALAKRLCDGELSAASVRARWQRRDGTFQSRQALTTIDPRWWLTTPSIENYYDPLWRTSEASCTIRDRSDGELYDVNFYGIRFEYSTLFEVIPGLREAKSAAPQQLLPQVESQGARRRGRPKGDFWEAMWADIAGRILAGQLVASQQADIEAAIQDWAVENDKSIAEATGRLRAKMLWEAYQREAIK